MFVQVKTTKTIHERATTINQTVPKKAEKKSNKINQKNKNHKLLLVRWELVGVCGL